MTESVQSSPPVSSPEGFWKLDIISLSLLGCFSLLAIVMIAFMWNGYQLLSHGAAVDRLLAEGDYEAAIPHLERIVARSPGSYDRQRQLGDCLLMRNPPAPQRAMEHYQMALKYNPDMLLDRELGMVYDELGQTERAQEHFNRVLQEHPDDPGVNFYMGRHYLKRAMLPEAAISFQAAAADKKWDERAAPYRRQLAARVFGDPEETTDD